MYDNKYFVFCLRIVEKGGDFWSVTKNAWHRIGTDVCICVLAYTDKLLLLFLQFMCAFVSTLSTWRYTYIGSVVARWGCGVVCIRWMAINMRKRVGVSVCGYRPSFQFPFVRPPAPLPPKRPRRSYLRNEIPIQFRFHYAGQRTLCGPHTTSTLQPPPPPSSHPAIWTAIGHLINYFHRSTPISKAAKTIMSVGAFSAVSSMYATRGELLDAREKRVDRPNTSHRSRRTAHPGSLSIQIAELSRLPGRISRGRMNTVSEKDFSFSVITILLSVEWRYTKPRHFFSCFFFFFIFYIHKLYTIWRTYYVYIYVRITYKNMALIKLLNMGNQSHCLVKFSF